MGVGSGVQMWHWASINCMTALSLWFPTNYKIRVVIITLWQLIIEMYSLLAILLTSHTSHSTCNEKIIMTKKVQKLKPISNDLGSRILAMEVATLVRTFWMEKDLYQKPSERKIPQSSPQSPKFRGRRLNVTCEPQCHSYRLSSKNTSLSLMIYILSSHYLSWYFSSPLFPSPYVTELSLVISMLNLVTLKV